MATISNAQGLLFAEISTEEVKLDGPPVTTLTGWFGAQQVGQIKSLITNTVNQNKGVVTHTVGDSILSSFADAQAALAAALDIQRRVAKAQNPSTGMLVKVRIGLAYGPVRVAAGKVSGDCVSAAGILLDKAQANEILADQSLVDAIGASKETRFEAGGLLDGIPSYRVVSSAPGAVPAAQPVPNPLPAAAPAPSPRPSAGPSLTLRYSGADRRFAPADGEIFMGRGMDVHVTIPEIHVSRKHAKIVWEDGCAVLVNLSQNGTCVRFASTGHEQTCMTKLALEGSGEIALCSRFGQVVSPKEIISYSLAVQ
ncbi:MAG: FHA domain-containing protein [Betaproteobacteria bacterium]|nr:FHA domain-containing protein [Betaproteobacteria bacterium]